MTPREMHIGVDLILQKINSSILSSVRPEEMDYLLNNEVVRFINQRIRDRSNDKNIGFQQDIKRYDDLKGLINPTITLPVYYRDDRSVFTFIPSNCLRIIKDRSVTKDLCGNIYNPTTTNQSQYTLVYQLEDPAPSNYLGFEMRINASKVFATNDYPQFLTGVPVGEMKFELIRFMLEAIRLKGYEAKYENFGDDFYRGSIIVKAQSSIIFTILYNNGASSRTINPTTTTFTKITPINGNEVDNVLLGTDEYNIMLDSQFGTTIARHPISTLDNGRINIFHKKKFIVSSVKLDFIRIPRVISLPLNQSCDLDEVVHQEIVDNLAKRLAAVTSAENYAQLLRENLLKE